MEQKLRTILTELSETARYNTEITEEEAIEIAYHGIVNIIEKKH